MPGSWPVAPGLRAMLSDCSPVTSAGLRPVITESLSMATEHLLSGHDVMCGITFASALNKQRSPR